MRYLLIYLLFICLPNSVLANGVDTLAILDSIKSAKLLIRTDIDRSQEKINDLLKVCEFLKYEEGQKEVYLAMSMLSYFQSDFEKTIDWSEKVIRISQKLGNKKDEAGGYVNIAMSLVFLNRYYEASQKINQGIILAAEINAFGLLGFLNIISANLYADLGLKKDAYKYYDDAIDFGEKAEEPYIEVGAAMYKANALSQAKEWNEARLLLEKYREKYQAIHYRFTPGLLLFIESTIYLQSNPKLALVKVNEMLAMCNDKDFLQFTVRARLNGMYASLALRDYHRAKKYLAIAEEGCEKLPLFFQVELLEAKAALQQALGNLMLALQHQNKANALHESLISQWNTSIIGELTVQSNSIIQDNLLMQNALKLDEQRSVSMRDWTTKLYIFIGLVFVFFLVLRRMYLKNEILKERIKNDLLEKNAILKEAILGKRQLIDNISHELRTPIYTMSLILDFFKNSTSAKDEKYLLEAYNISNGYLSNFVDNMLAINQSMQRGELLIHEEIFELRKLLSNIVRPISIDTSNTFELKIDGRIPEQLLGDVPKLTQILFNLVDNANKYTQSGKVTIEVDAVHRKPDKLALFFKIKDTGKGISKENLERIFSAFNNIDNNPRFQGVGIGLNVVRKLLQLIGSEIKIHSALGKGSTFSFYLWLGIPPVQADKESKVTKNIQAI